MFSKFHRTTLSNIGPASIQYIPVNTPKTICQAESKKHTKKTAANLSVKRRFYLY